MSMLAERKIKQKWSLNPRGKIWSEDSNKFGQKMLEKMGWSHGKGLGAKGDGIVEHVKISYKNDSAGMGYKETDDQWTEHDSNFNALLQSLSGQVDSEKELKLSSLEKKSEKSKVRVHYKKFTRGKDLSRCSDKDLANIFGKKSFKEPPQPSPKIEPKNEKTHSDSFSHNAGSMVDYFKKKLPNFGKTKDYVVGNNGVLKKQSESEEESCTGFGFIGRNDCLKKSSDSEEGENYSGFGFKHKSSVDIPNGTPTKIKVVEVNSNGLSNPAFDPLFGKVEVQKHVLNTIEEEDSDEEKKEDKKKKKKDKNWSILSVEDSQDNISVRKKKTEDQDNDVSAMYNPNFEDTDQRHWHINDTFEVKRKKKKKNKDNLQVSEDLEIKPKKKKSNENGLDGSYFANNSEDLEVKNSVKLAFDNPSFQDGNCENCHINETFEIKRKKKKKDFEIKSTKKKKNKETTAIDNPNFEEGVGNDQSSYVSEEFEVKRKKKNKESIAMNNPNFEEGNGNDGSSYVNEEFEVKRKKKNKENIAMDNPNFEEGDDNDRSSYVNEDFEVKRKKKNKESIVMDNPNFEEGEDNDRSSYVNEEFEVKRKKKKESIVMDNPNFEEGDVNDQSSYVNEDFDVKRKKKNKESIAIDNPNFEEGDDYEQSGYFNGEFEVHRKRKKEKSLNSAIDNPNFQDDGRQDSYVNDDFEIKRKKKKKRKEDDSFALDNPNFDLSDTVASNTAKNEAISSVMEITTNSTEEISCDLILNVTSTPYVPKEPSKSSLKRRKSVRFSSVTEERIIPNNEDIKRDELFEINSLVISDSMNNGVSDLEEISKKIDGFQAEIENDINEAKVRRYVGEVGNPDGENEKLPEGTKLKFKDAKFGKSPIWLKKDSMSNAKSSYKHLIKGDIILGFKNTNLHEIKGYGVSDNSR